MKFSTKLLLLSFSAILAFGCQPEDKNDDSTALLFAALAGAGSGGDCTVATEGKSTVSTFTTVVPTLDQSGTISQVGTIPFVNHQHAVLKLEGTFNGDQLRLSGGEAFVIVYKTTDCPLDSTKIANFGSDYTLGGGLTDSNSDFPNSYTIDNGSTGTIVFGANGTYYVFIYAIPSRGQEATLSYERVN